MTMVMLMRIKDIRFLNLQRGWFHYMLHFGVQLLVIDGISIVGAAQFQIVSRRLDQVRKALWRERFHKAPPNDDDGFDGIGVVCMGDCAQLPPVLSTLLLMGSPISDAKN